MNLFDSLCTLIAIELNLPMRIPLITSKKTSNHKKNAGEVAEALAEEHLKQHNCSLIKANFNCRYGEIDRIVLDNSTLVFVEVRFRSSKQFGGAAASITYQKQQKLILTAQYFLQTHPQYANYPMRFDAIAISSTTSDILSTNNSEIQWVKSAFSADGF